MNSERKRTTAYWVLPLLGAVFCLWYVKNATCDVVYSDYIRLVNSYLPDVYNPEKFFVPDVLTRIPINYLCRIINVELLGFSVTLERVLGVVSLGLAGWVFGIYGKRMKLGLGWFALLMVVMFSLNKWEMLTNGSGWSHFFAFACFYYHELVLDRVWVGDEKRGDRGKLLVLPWLIILGTAGPYCAIYAVTILMSYGFCLLKSSRAFGSWDKRYLAYMACTLIPLLLYIWSNSMAVEEHAGATGRSLGTILGENPFFPLRFLLKSFAGILIGGEELNAWMDAGALSDAACFLIGFFVVCGYLLALWLNLHYRLYRRTLMPLMLLVGGGLNHVIIFISRYIFEQESYALSSRYALQFQVGILGIVLTFALVWGLEKRGTELIRGVMAVFCLAILLGNGYTTYRELKKAPSREALFEEKAALAKEVPYMSQEELRDRGQELERVYEYRKGVDKIQNAFRILEENHLNVFRQ